MNDHNTKAGVWGKIHILKGQLEYTIHTDPQEIIELSPEKFGVVEPEQLHKVTPLGEVEFFVEFYKEDQ